MKSLNPWRRSWEPRLPSPALRILAALSFAVVAIAIEPGQTRTSLPGFEGVDWGASRALVKREFAARGTFRLYSEDDVFAYFEGPFLGAASTLALGFQDDELFEAILTMGGGGASALADYRDIVKALAGLYGTPTRAVEYFQPPYAAGDGREAEAILSNKATFSSQWTFKDGNDVTAFVDNSDLATIVIFTNNFRLARYLHSLGAK